jgi:hypothetical protein
MIEGDQIVATLETALAFDTSVIVRSAGAIAEIHGLFTVRREAEWITLGDAGSSHVHLNIQDGSRLHYTQPDAGNAALELRGPDGDLLCRVSFRRTNQARAEQYHPECAARIRARFGWLAERTGS